ncbi:organoarsenical effux MFS transporter ArsJ [Phormidium tenue]|uniref:MFS transporter n=1 Tax=Phormidium tenue NIES-30 TaxID=549789 RepID=A0A1U7J3I2_9CYAN|nr:organoarsenical effux MFS transporter ArsJ [Phormidium tenue]MBD2233444.1 organoarsenical effux MFS transporter ArsJ [Phormidium tenue FACHB-1052]OKH46892.1 MFS transporter [Phormidium tenue NIES-30]
MTTSTFKPESLRNYAIITAAYWGFTLTDGALRMMVLLHFHVLGYRPFAIAMLFLFYEVFGVVTNFFGGWIGSQVGIRQTLYGGIALQIFALVMLSCLNPDWGVPVQVGYVMAAQACSGIAKDLTKMSSKSAIRLVVPKEAASRLFKWVAVLTGSKNALKGVGFFVGAALLEGVGFRSAVLLQAVLLGIILLLGALLPAGMGKIGKKVPFKQLFSKSKAINVLSAARFFLFGSRDVWFVVALPVFLYEVLGWRFMQVGSYMALWVIGYGMVQFLAPQLLRKDRTGQVVPKAKTILFWTSILTAIPALIALTLMAGVRGDIAVTGGLVVFGVVFAFNSAVHSYLVLAYTEDKDVSLNVGFYYMANSGGRLLGTIASGLVYQWLGLVGCLGVSSLFVLAAALITTQLPDPRPAEPVAVGS